MLLSTKMIAAQSKPGLLYRKKSATGASGADERFVGIGIEQ